MTGKEAIAILKRMQEPEAWEPQINEAAFEALEMAIKELEGNGMAQERKYTFGNDGFSLENAYHDCKLVFDGITDDDSFQKADTGLILYFANEIIYALHEALEGKDNVPDTNVGDIISRQWLMECVNEGWIKFDTEEDENRFIHLVRDIAPSAQPNTIPLDWIQKYADDWEDIGYAYDNPILGMLEDWRREQDE